jgi:hypothetical protein
MYGDRRDNFLGQRQRWRRSTLAQKAGITVPAVRIETVGQQLVLLLRRFDREAQTAFRSFRP